MRIVCDVDGIVADTMPAWLEEIHRTTGVLAVLDDITRWELETCPPLTSLTHDQIFDPLQVPGFLRGVKLMPGAAEGLKRLAANGHQVYLVTARSGAVSIAETLEWRRRVLPDFPENHIIFCYDKYLMAADVLIDDRTSNLMKYHQHHPGAHLVSISAPYNQDIDRSLVHVVSRDFGPWDAICYHLENLP